MAPRTILGVACVLVGMLAGPALADARPFVTVENLKVDRDATSATVSADVHWDRPSAQDLAMKAGSVRLVAVRDGDHRPTLLGVDRTEADITARPVQPVSIVVDDPGKLAAMAPGNRVVLTASQARPYRGARVDRAYVTVAQLQGYGSKQPHIGTDDCSDRAVTAGAVLDYCDLVGADLDHLVVSLHAPAAFECKVQSASTCMRRADLTGATMTDANLSGLNLAGARLNGTDISDSQLDNTSLAGAEAVGLDASGATSDQDGTDSAADLFEARLRDADFSDTTFSGVSFAQADLRGATIVKARWVAVIAQGVDFTGADLSGTTIGAAPSDFQFSDFTDAVLFGRGGQSDIDAGDLEWAYLCRTVLTQRRSSDRDCKSAVEEPTKPLPDGRRTEPYIRVGDATIGPAGAKPRSIHANVNWSAGSGMLAGAIRVVAVDARTGLPTVIDERTYDGDLPDASDYTVDVTDSAKLAAMAPGNRVVLTASQHGPGDETDLSYVTVTTLQKGPGRGRVGMYDCSRMALTNAPELPLDFCDLTGADLSRAGFDGTFMREASLTGAKMGEGRLAAVQLMGAAMGGVQANGATWSNVNLFTAFAPRLSLHSGAIVGSPLRARNLDGADFHETGFVGSTTTLAGASLRNAVFDRATLDHSDLAFTDLTGARLVGVTSLGERERQGGSTLFLANLTHADLGGSTWTLDEAGDVAWQWATLCATTMPTDAGGIDGDRDCPRMWGPIVG